MDEKQSAKRLFLKRSAALIGMTLGGMRAASGQNTNWSLGYDPNTPKDLREYGQPSRYAGFVRSSNPAVNRATDDVHTPLQDTMGIITPSALHYTVSHGSAVPDIDPRQHRLLIHGMVDRPMIFTMEELKRFPSVSRIHFIECAYNGSPSERKSADATVERTHGQVSCSEWTGVLLSVLLREAGLQKGASWILAEGAEAKNRAKSIPLAKAIEDAIVAYGQNGEPVRPEQGFPLRLVTPGYEGPNNVKWLRRIKVGNAPFMAHADSPGHTSLRPDGKARWFQFEMGVNSVITFPSGGQRLSDHGFYEIRGLAWSGGGAIRKVEVSTDGGRTWKDAQLQEPIHRMAFTRFRFPWNWNGQEVVLQSRAADERGDVQPTLSQLNKVWGVNSDFWLSFATAIPQFNPIQPWKLTSDGVVQNALFS
jgi:sulfane dehydrogenase subunit SoxC